MVEGVEQVSQSQVANSKTQLLMSSPQMVRRSKTWRVSPTASPSRMKLPLILGGTSGDHFRNRGDEPQTIDASDGVAVFSDEKPASIHFLLHPVVGIGEEVFSCVSSMGLRSWH
jgi:hypothetical protein